MTATISPSRGRARIGVLVPFTNTNLEADCAMLRPHGISFHFARTGGYDADAVPDSEQMSGLGEAPLDEPLRLLTATRPDVILYGCTSATLSHGTVFDEELTATIKENAGVPTVTAAGALIAALTHLGARKIAFASPYVRELNDRAIAFLASAGFETVSRADVGNDLGNEEQGALTPDDVKELARRAVSDDADAIVLSCTDMRAAETVEDLEWEFGKPVVTSNQALLFATMKVLGITDHEINCGQLLR